MEARNRLREEAAVLDSGLMSGREHSHPTEKIRDASTSIKMEGALPIPDQQNIVSPVHRRVNGHRSRFSLNQRIGVDEDSKKPRRSFCRSWCEMWFLLAQSKFTCIGLSAVLFGGGLLLILLTVFGGLMECPRLHGAVVFCLLMATLSISLGFLCCCYHWVKDDDDLPFALFCVAYCLLLLFIFITIAGTVVVFTRIHPLGPNQPPPGIPFPPGSNNTLTLTSGGVASDALSAVGKEDCAMVELPLGVLVICYVLSLGFAFMSYFACILALGATSDIPPL